MCVHNSLMFLNLDPEKKMAMDRETIRYAFRRKNINGNQWKCPQKSMDIGHGNPWICIHNKPGFCPWKILTCVLGNGFNTPWKIFHEFLDGLPWQIYNRVCSNDCVFEDFDPDIVHADYATLVKIATSESESVVISGI